MTKSFAPLFLLVLIVSGWPSSSWAEGGSQQEMRSLDEQVQEIKTDVLGIATELSRLEEKLLYPSNTQVAVFISLSPQDPFRLDAVQIHIDGELATHHIYSFKELDALKHGGIQRIYTGNYGPVPTNSKCRSSASSKTARTTKRAASSPSTRASIQACSASHWPAGAEAIELQNW